MTSVHVRVEDVTSLGGSSGLTTSHELVVLTTMLNFRDHLKLVRVVYDEFSRLSLVGPCCAWVDFAL